MGAFFHVVEVSEPVVFFTALEAGEGVLVVVVHSSPCSVSVLLVSVSIAIVWVVLVFAWHLCTVLLRLFA